MRSLNCEGSGNGQFPALSFCVSVGAEFGENGLTGVPQGLVIVRDVPGEFVTDAELFGGNLNEVPNVLIRPQTPGDLRPMQLG